MALAPIEEPILIKSCTYFFMYQTHFCDLLKFESDHMQRYAETMNQTCAIDVCPGEPKIIEALKQMSLL